MAYKNGRNNQDSLNFLALSMDLCQGACLLKGGDPIVVRRPMLIREVIH